jgi:hypothetical protein
MRAIPIACAVLFIASCSISGDPVHQDRDASSGDGDRDAASDERPDAGGEGDGDLDAGGEPDAATDEDSGAPLSRTPRRMLLADEGSASLHHLDLDDASRNWRRQISGGDPCCNKLRDLQLVGGHRVLVSTPSGYVELDLNDQGTPVRSATLTPVPGLIEAARRLPDGHTIVAGNGGGGIFVSEFDENDTLVQDHQQVFGGLNNLRGLRLTEQGTFLFMSDTAVRKAVYEGSWEGNAQLVFELPGDVAAGHMTKAVRTGPNEVTISTGYGASLLRIDTQNDVVTKLIGGAGQPQPDGAERPLEAHFFGGFQLRPSGDYVVANWIDHGLGHNDEGYQLLQYDHEGTLVWYLDQTDFPDISSLHNVIVLDGLDTSKLHDDRGGLLEPL